MVRLTLNRELQFLYNLLQDMANSVYEMTKGAIKAFTERDLNLSENIIKLDSQVDYYEHMIKITVTEILALQQPVARDLRKIVSAFEVSKNLERAADHAVNIVELVSSLPEEMEEFKSQCHIRILEMAKEALLMFEKAFNVFLQEDSKEAREVLARDDRVDELEREIKKTLLSCINEKSNLLGLAFTYLLAIENLERIADLACNIAEAAIFVSEGRIVKYPEEVPLTFEPKTYLEESPTFQLILKHLRFIKECLERLPLALEAYLKGDEKFLQEVSHHIREIEREADKVKTNIRSHLPRGLILPVEKFILFSYLKEQDALADRAEALLNLFTFHQVPFTDEIARDFQKLLAQALEPLDYFEELVSSTFGYLTTWEESLRERAKELVRKIRHTQYLTENLSIQLEAKLYQTLKDPKDLWHAQRILSTIAGLSSHAENTADYLRAMLAK